MVKTLTWMFALAVLFLAGLPGLTQADAKAPKQMMSALQTQYKAAHYDYKDGSLIFQHVKTFQLSTPITVQKNGKKVQVNQVTASVASYKTVRDYIFYKDWNEFAFYAPQINQVLTLGDVSNVKPLQDYQNKYKSSVSLELGPILLIMALLLIVPFIVLIMWSKTKYSVMGYKIENNLLDEHRH